MSAGRRLGAALLAVLVFAAFTLFEEARGWAQDSRSNRGISASSEESGRGSEASGQSSQASGGSSEQSGKGSEGSGEGSQASGQSSETSSGSSQQSEKSSGDSSRGSAAGGRVLLLGTTVVALGAIAVGVAVAVTKVMAEDQRQARLLRDFMRRHHALLTKDVALGRGPLLEAWTAELSLSPTEKARFLRTLEGSAEQTALLDALDGHIDEVRARRFARGFYRLTERALGPARARQLAAGGGPRPSDAR
jgi:hypothetical protein